MKKAAVMLAQGYEEGESLFVVDIIRRGGFECDVVGLESQQVTGCNGITALADKVFDGSLDGYDLVVLPGGMPGAANLAANDALIEAVKKMAAEGKLVASICAGPMSLDRAGLLDGRRFTCFPTRKDTIGQKGEWVDELVVRDGNVITSQGPGTTLHFAYALVDALSGNGDALREGMLYRKVLEAQAPNH
jgi:4-methyl-5(b-hydroxyethyl)-thiazole monophosphate biosynthesis